MACTRRSWRKLHLGIDADIGQIVAASLTPRRWTTAPRSAPCSIRSRDLPPTADTIRTAFPPVSPSVTPMRP